MARLARIVVPGLPYHVAQRGNRRQKIFFEDGDYALYSDLLAERRRKAGVAPAHAPDSKQFQKFFARDFCLLEYIAHISRRQITRMHRDRCPSRAIVLVQ